MSSPLRHRSPVKDAEVGPTPQKTNNVTSPASAPAAASTGIRGFVSRNKKLLVIAGVVGAVVLIAASVKGSQNAAARASANALSSKVEDPSDSEGNPGHGKAPTKAPSIYDTPSTATPSTEDEENEDEETDEPTPPPTPEIPPIATPVCNLTGNLGKAPYFNALFFDTFWSNGSSCEGRLGVKNRAWVNQFGVGNGMFTPPKGCPTADHPKFEGGNYAFIVQGGLTLNGTTIDNGGLGYGYEETDVNVTYWNTRSGCEKRRGYNEVDFGALETSVRTASSAISAMTNALSKTTKPNPNTLQFNLNESIMTEYFIVKEADLVGVSVFKLVGTPKTFRGRTATIIINVVKDAANSDGSLIINNWSTQGFGEAMASNVIWNFAGYQTLSFQQGSWFGSILALDASFETCIGDFYGGVFAKGWNTKQKEIQYKFHEARFKGLVFTSECT